MGSTQYPVFTIGHSNHSPEAFVELLAQHGVDEVIDVRSSPSSRYLPHFNHDVLSQILDDVGIDYVFLGGQLGGRPPGPSYYDADGRVLYERVSDTEFFDDGIGQVVRVADERRVALMCAEKDPLDCHRTLLLAQSLVKRGVAVGHILADGGVEDHIAALNRLVDMLKLPPNGDMFRSKDEVIAEAVARQAKKVGYVGAKPSARSDHYPDDEEYVG